MFPIVTISFPTQNFIIKKLPNIQKVGEIAQEELNPKLKNHKYIYICVCVYMCIYIYIHVHMEFSGGSVVKNLPAIQEM